MIKTNYTSPFKTLCLRIHDISVCALPTNSTFNPFRVVSGLTHTTVLPQLPVKISIQYGALISERHYKYLPRLTSNT